ncbi:TetR/AcrR family transcriptional regulator [Aquisalimonas sp. 2447]|uniref:TetR/AcrR family transcriptional regulator n=1 Tax=Aquisalimonas sp. 2447 TaxID=2740807 RepID=UPI00143270C4|nr:TetR/AcrR family transcriptional regulator [Aquisalimonas sp. 2447]QIT56499.1 TetR/AcrR family transcriptional regulator [Aquisalimonas sp. 2447]
MDSAGRRYADTPPEDKRQSIVEAAARVFEARGLAGASMRLIAREAGCTTGAIYPHFGGKESLYAEVLAQSLHALYASIRQAIHEASTEDKGRAGLRAFYDYYRDHPLELSLGLYLFQGARPVGLTRDLNHSLNRSLQSVYRIMTDALRTSGHEQPEMRCMGGVAQAVGVLILNQTGRMKVLGREPDEQMAFYLRDL